MKLAEFKRRLMTEPGDRDPAMVDARAQGGEFAQVAAASDQFEHALARALNVPVPHGLADRIILEQSMSNTRGKISGRFGGWQRWGAMAAALALAVSLGLFIGATPRDVTGAGATPSLADLRQNIEWHWRHDGADVLAVAAGHPLDATEVEGMFADLGAQLTPELLARIRLSKFCPTPNGRGVHAILATDQGPLTVYYMPKTRVQSSPLALPLENGFESMVVNLERGSLALVGEAGRALPEVAGDIARQIEIAPGVTI